MSTADVLVVGAGLSGLVCAQACQQKGLRVHVLEASQCVGGRVQSDTINGAICDHGFQVFLPAYPTARTLVKPLNINWKAYPKTAIIHGEKTQWFGPPFSSGIGEKLPLTPGDYWQLLRDTAAGFRHSQSNQSLSTDVHLRHYSSTVEQQFLRPFFASVFLDPELQAPAHLFQYYLSLFLRGGVAIPSGGMGEISQRLASQLLPDTLRLNTPVAAIKKTHGYWHAETPSGLFSSPIIVIATAHHHACELFPELAPASRALPVSTHYFLTDTVPDTFGPLTLFPSGNQCHHVAIPTQVAPEYTADHRHLIMATTYGTDTVSADAIKDELGAYTCTKHWAWIHHIGLAHSLPEVRAKLSTDPSCIFAGDWTTFPSIEGACQSGISAAQGVGTR